MFLNAQHKARCPLLTEGNELHIQLYATDKKNAQASLEYGLVLIWIANKMQFTFSLNTGVRSILACALL